MLQLRRSYHSSTAFLHLTENRHCRFVLGLFFGGHCCFHFCSELLRRKVRSGWGHTANVVFLTELFLWALHQTDTTQIQTTKIWSRCSTHHNTLCSNQRQKNNHLYYFMDPLQQRLCAPQCNTSESSSRVYGSFFIIFLVDANVDSNRQPWSKHTQ